jgi:hypothetical protein
MPVFFDSFASFLTCGLDNHIVVRFMPRVWLVAISESMGQSLHDSTGCTSPHIRQVRSSHLGRTADLRSSLIPMCCSMAATRGTTRQASDWQRFHPGSTLGTASSLDAAPPLPQVVRVFCSPRRGKILAVEPRHTSNTRYSRLGSFRYGATQQNSGVWDDKIGKELRNRIHDKISFPKENT